MIIKGRIVLLTLVLALTPLLLLVIGSCTASRPDGKTPTEEEPGSEPRSPDQIEGDRAHVELHKGALFPSALQCAKCHPDHFREWSVSAHAYAQMSPVFNAMYGTLLKQTNGTLGDFCIRCHTPVGMQLGEPLFTSITERHPASREGVTCIVCHRVNKAYGKNSGRRYLEEGDIFRPVSGPVGPERLRDVLADRNTYPNLVTEAGETGRKIHADVEPFYQLSRPGFCGACHDVTFLDGFRLEEAFSHYKASPAAGNGVTCQDCHMGREPGGASGDDEGPAARIGGLKGIPTPARKRTNHMIVGPDYSIIHPALYPLNPDLARELGWAKEKLDRALLAKWLKFDWRAKWGSEEFESTVTDETPFPEEWKDDLDREAAWELIEGQLDLLKEAAAARLKLLKRGYRFGEAVVTRSDERGLAFGIKVVNGTDGHPVPTGFVAERIVFVRVTVTDRDGTVVFTSGDLDPNGDVRDTHSVYVHNGERPRDEQLFTLQSRFITQNVRGSERERVLSINHSATPLPFVRPARFPSTLVGRPRGIRIHRMSIEPGGHRWATYKVNGSALTGNGPYRARIQLVAGMVPPNLVHAIKDVGFDYGMSARSVAAEIVRGHLILWERELELTRGENE